MASSDAAGAQAREVTRRAVPLLLAPLKARLGLVSVRARARVLANLTLALALTLT